MVVIKKFRMLQQLVIRIIIDKSYLTNAIIQLKINLKKQTYEKKK
jgi:hypothetical protein